MFGKFNNIFDKIKNASLLSKEILILQKNIKKHFKDFLKEINVNDEKKELVINKENEDFILEKMRILIQKSIKEVENVKSLNFNQKLRAKKEINEMLIKSFKKEIPYFKKMKKSEIKEKLGLY